MVARQERELRIRQALSRHEARRPGVKLWLFLLLSFAALVLFVDIVGGIALPVARLYPRVLALGALVAAVLVIWRPQWAIPVFVMLIAPLRVAPMPRQISIAGVPMGALPLAILALTAFWILWPLRQRRGPRVSRPEMVAIGLAVLLVLSSLPAALTRVYGSNLSVVPRAMVSQGVVLPVLLFLLTLSWLRLYNGAELLRKSLIASCAVALAAGIVQIYARRLGVADSVEASQFRYNLLGFAGANNSGLILVLLYPLVFLGLWRGRRWGLVLPVLLAVGFWGMAVASFSRSTPVVLGVETLGLLLLSRQRGRVLLVLVVLMVAAGASLSLASKETSGAWIDRFTETDLLGHLMGHTRRATAGDEFRWRMQTELWAQIRQRPQGGYGATDAVDPESLYLDTALQLGWAPALGLLFVQAAAVVALLRVWRRGAPEKRDYALALAAGVAGSVIYGATTGANIAKVTSPHGAYGLLTNPAVAVMLALVMALVVWAVTEPAPRWWIPSRGPGGPLANRRELSDASV